MANLPARNYTWPPFERGNLAALKHGADSERMIEPLANEMAAAIVEELPYLHDPSYEPALRAWARTEARLELCARYIDEHGLFDDEGNPLPVARLTHELELRAMQHRSRLGLDPVSRSKIMKNYKQMQVFDLARAMSEVDEDDDEETA